VSPAPDLSPHPLVTALGSNLGAQGSPLRAASVEFNNATNQAAAGGGDGGGDGGNGGGNGGRAPLGAGPVGAAGAIAAQRGTQQASALANALAQDPNAPRLVSFAGYLGGVAATDSSGDDWRLFYFDWKLQTWLVVAESSIVYRVAIQDPKWPFGQLDVIWVRREAAVGEGSRPLPPDIPGQFLRGDFVSAGDFRTDSVAGTLSASTGVFCDAETVGCCRFGTR
jgi:hypothetical protein